MRLPRTACTLALLAGCALFAAAPAAHAKRGKKNKGAKVELVRPAEGADADATGVLRVKTRKSGVRKLVLKLRNLDPKTWYEVRDLDTDELLGTVRTNRRGKATKKIKLAADAEAFKASTGGTDGVTVVRQGDDSDVLMGELDDEGTDDTTGASEPGYGFAWYGDFGGINAQVSMFGEERADTFSLTLCIPADDENEETLYELFATDADDGELPLDVDEVAELSERRFRIVDADGAVVFDSELPEFETFDEGPYRPFDDIEWPEFDGEFEDFGDWDDFEFGDWENFDWTDMDFGFDEPNDRGGRGRRANKGSDRETESPEGPFTAPFTLEIADAAGALVEVGELSELLPPEFEFGFAFYGDGEGPEGSATLDRVTVRDEVFETFVFAFEHDGRGQSHIVEFSSFDDEFPLDLAELADLGGRDFEVRNDVGTAVLSGTLPELGDDADERTGDAADESGDGPFTLWVADDDGALQEIAEFESIDFGFGGFLDGFGLYGDEDGLNASVGMSSIEGCPGWGRGDEAAETHESFSVAFCIPGDDASGELLYEFYTSNEGDGLPLDAASVTELEGLAFEIRNADGTAVITGDLPELEGAFGFSWRMPEFEGTAADEAGEAPFTIWIEAESGTWTDVGELEELDWSWDWDMGWDDDRGNEWTWEWNEDDASGDDRSNAWGDDFDFFGIPAFGR